MQAAASLLATAAIPEDRREKARSVIVRQTEHLVRLVDDLLDLSRVRRGTLDLVREPFDLRDAIYGGIEIITPRLCGKSQHLTTNIPDAPVTVVADRTRLTQVVSNLLINASKFSGEGSEIRLTLERSDQAAHVVVDDQGIGIEPALLPHIFDAFRKGPDQSAEGLGLGLNIVKRLVELHGGTITATSEGPGCGARFVVSLPLGD
jgi:signal transduction histidine kinase